MSTMARLSTVVRVGIAEGAVVREPERIRTTGLGSCVGIAMYDKAIGVAGLVHIMLPTAPVDTCTTPTKYADSAIPWLLEELLTLGCRKSGVRAKIAGGAQMFASTGKSEIMRIGPRNVDATKETLAMYGIPIVAADVGGNIGRTIEFDVATEELTIKTALRGTYSI